MAINPVIGRARFSIISLGILPRFFLIIMAKSKSQKEKEVKNLSENLSQMKAAVFVDFTHLNVADMEELRAKLREQGAVLRVVKKSLLGVALKKDKDLKALKKGLEIEGPLSIAFGLEDEVAPAKILAAFKKEHKKFEILGGVLDNQYLSKREVLNLAKLPGQEELRAQLVGVISAPVSGFVNVLSGNLRNLINILKNLSEKSGE